jgi:cobalt/nickel transport system permease protein
VVASLSVALQLAISGTTPANLAIPAMLGVHMLIGIGEGLITVGALAFLFNTRPDLLQASQMRTNSSTVLWVAGLLIALALVVLAPLASARPDGLEWVAEQQGFLDTARDPLYNLIPDYLLPGVSNEAAATILAGFIGALLVFGMFLAVALLRRKRQPLEN